MELGTWDGVRAWLATAASCSFEPSIVMAKVGRPFRMSNSSLSWELADRPTCFPPWTLLLKLRRLWLSCHGSKWSIASHWPSVQSLCDLTWKSLHSGRAP